MGGVCLAAALLSMAGCDEKASRRAALTEPEIRSRTLALKPARPDHLIVCGETITWEDVLAALPDENAAAPSVKGKLEEEAKDMSLRRFVEEHRLGMQQRLNRRIEGIVLSLQAERELGKKVEDKLNEYADQALRKFIVEEHGGNGAEADEAMQKMGVNRVTFRQWKKKQILAEYLVESRYARNRPITYNELLARYDEMKDKEFVREGTLQLRLIDIDVTKVKLADPNDDPSRKARQLAGDLRQKIDAGADFAELAKKYSDDTRAEEGGLWRPRNPDALAAPYDVLAPKAKSLQRGEVAGPIEATGHFFILKVEEKQERSYRRLDDVQDEVRKDILYRRRLAVIDELDAEVVRQVNAADTTHFVDYCLEKFHRQVRERQSTSQ